MPTTAHLRDELATAVAANHSALDEAVRKLQRQYAQRLDRQVARLLNARGRAHGLPPADWTLSAIGGGDLGDTYGITGQTVAGPQRSEAEQNAADAELARRWAEVLELAPVDRTLMPGTVEFTGLVDGVEVRAWAIADRDAWDAEVDRRYGGGRR